MLYAPATVRHKPNTVYTTDHLLLRPQAVPRSHTFSSAAPQVNRRFRRHLANVLFRLGFPRPTKCRRIADYDNEEVEITIREWLRISEHDLNGNGIFKILPLWKKCMKCVEGDVTQQ